MKEVVSSVPELLFHEYNSIKATMRSKKLTNLKEPLYAVEAISSPRSNKTTNRYLPPYRYDDNESILNVYLSSDEAYCTAAKALVFEFEMSKNNNDPYDIMIRSLAISQIKMFADAHMERALRLPTFPERHETTEVSLIRRIDAIYGHVLFEFYASKDGILLVPQIEVLQKHRRRVEEEKNENSVIGNSSLQSSTQLKDVVFRKACNQPIIPSLNQKDEPNQVQPDSSFDRIYDIDIEQNDLDRNDSRSTSSKLRRELLSEISDLKNIMRSTSSDSERNTYKKHLRLLINELDNSHGEEHTIKHQSRRLNMEREHSITETVETREETDVVSNKRTIVARETISTNSDEKILQSRGFVHISDVDRGFKSVTLMAHDNMKDGYLFQAKYRNTFFSVRVPSGGVNKGDIFSSPMLHPSDEKENVIIFESLLDGMEVPYGSWRDSIFNCCNDALLSMSCMCPNGKLSRLTQSNMSTSLTTNQFI